MPSKKSRNYAFQQHLKICFLTAVEIIPSNSSRKYAFYYSRKYVFQQHLKIYLLTAVEYMPFNGSRNLSTAVEICLLTAVGNVPLNSSGKYASQQQ